MPAIKNFVSVVTIGVYVSLGIITRGRITTVELPENVVSVVTTKVYAMWIKRYVRTLLRLCVQLPNRRGYG